MPRQAARSLGRALIGRCPECGQGKLFTGFFGLVETCPECGVRHERLEGTWAAAAGLAIAAGMTTGCMLSVTSYLQTRDPEQVTWLGPTLASAAVVLVAYRVFKALLFGALHRAGWVTPDPVIEGNVIYLDRIREERARDTRKTGTD